MTTFALVPPPPPPLDEDDLGFFLVTRPILFFGRITEKDIYGKIYTGEKILDSAVVFIVQSRNPNHYSPHVNFLSLPRCTCRPSSPSTFSGALGEVGTQFIRSGFVLVLDSLGR